MTPGINVIKHFTVVIYECLNVPNKLECLSLASLSNRLMFESKACAHPKEKHLKGAILTLALALLVNIRPGWKNCQDQTLAYYENS